MDVIPDGQATSAAPDPVALISALMDAERVVPDAPKAQEPPAEAAQPETEAEYEPEANAEVEGQDAEPDSGEEVATIPLDQLEAIELETTYKGVDGKDVTEKLPIKAIREGFMRGQDYTRKTQELARQRDELGQKIRQGIESERQQYQQTLQQLEAAILETAAPELKNVDWNALAANDPFEYVKLKNRAEQITNALNSVKVKQQEVKVKAEAEQRQVLQETAQKTWASLESERPGWSQDTYQKVLKSAEPLGYTTDEVGKWLDPRAIKLLHKAHLYDQLKAGTPAPQKKVVKAPVAVKPNASQPVSRTAQRQSNALSNLRKSGSVNDMASFIANMK